MKKLFAVFVLLLLISYIFLLFPVTDPPDMVKFLIVSQIIFLLYLAVYFLGKHINFSFRTDKNSWVFVIGSAVLLRIIISVFSVEQPYLSDDVYRYIWEGKIVSHAYNPFIYSPAGLKESGFADDTIYPLINHPWHVTIYPPLSQYLFVVAYLIGGDSIFGFKILSFMFELLSMILMLQLIRTFKLPDWSYLLYIFSPLILIEFLFSNHLDILGLPFFIWMLIKLHNTKPSSILIGLLIALGVLIKLYLFFFLPFLFFFFKGKDRLYFSITFIFTLFIFYLPFIASSGVNVFGSLVPYLENWQYNGSVFLLFKHITGETIARYLCYGLLLLSYLPLLFLKRFKGKIYLQMFLIFGLYLILTPSVFNWYLLWIIPFVILLKNYSFIILSGTIFLSYHVLIGYYDNGVWSDYPVLSILTYAPFYVMICIELYSLFRKKVRIEL